MNVKVTYYLDITSSWCYWAEPAWRELKQKYSRAPVDFEWAIALLDKSALPKTRSQAEWFYRRSGTIMRSPFMLKSGWITGAKEYLAPNCVAEAAKDLGITDDRVRLALAEAALCAGKKVANWDIAVAVATWAANLDSAALLRLAKSPEIEKRVRASTAEFRALQVTQRPTFVLKSNIDDRAIFSGLIKAGPIAAAIDAMLEDAVAYASHAAHFGLPPGH